MKQGITLKLKIDVNSEQELKLIELQEQYRKACQFVSDFYFEHHFEHSRYDLHDELYQTIRSKFGLKAQQSASVFITVMARYKTIESQLKKKDYKYQDEETKKWHFIQKDIHWLQKPVQFKKPQNDMVYNRDWNFTKDNTIKMTTLGSRIEVSTHFNYFDSYLSEGWKLGTAKLVNKLGKWFLHIGATKEIDEYNKENTEHVVGIDRGLNFLLTTYDEKEKTHFVNGKDITHKRNKYAKLRQELQSTNTKSSKRKLKAINQRENRWMTDVNHQLSKALVDKYGKNTVFVLEDLENINWQKSYGSSERNKKHSDWAFYQLEQFITYKAILAGSVVVKVSAQYTSQRCPKCGSIDKNNRNHKLSEYHCKTCNYRSNDDRVGAMNIQELGKLWVSGETNPKYNKTLPSD